MLRPATPLTVAFLIAFVLLLLATLSTPIIKSIPLGQNGGYNFGVFGYCPIDGTPGTCSDPQVGYPPSEVDSPQQQDYTLTAGARRTLSYILIVHPIAAFMVLICTILAFAAHFRRPSHSPRFLLFLLIFTFPTLLVTLLAFLVDILIFIPHPQWGTWIVLPATIIVTACGVFTCAMRRTLVSRKARKKRIAENEDMNGSTYYAMKQEIPMTKPPPAEAGYARAESPPPIDYHQTNGVAAYDNGASPYSEDSYARNVRPEDDRTPLNRRDPSLRSASTGRGDPSGTTMVGLSPRTRDDDPMDPMSPTDGQSYGPSDSQRMRGGPTPPYGPGRGDPRFYGRGRGGPRGGGYYGPQRGGYPPRGGLRDGMRGGPPPGWNPRGGPSMRGRPPPPGYGGSYARSLSAGRSPARSPDNYGPPPMAYDGQGPIEPGQDRQWLEQDPYAYQQTSPTEGYGYDNRQQPPTLSRGPSEVTRDPATFGFSGRQPSPARSQSAPRAEPAPPMPPMPVGMHEQTNQMDNRSPSGQTGEGPLNFIPLSDWKAQNEPAELPAESNSPKENQIPVQGHYHETNAPHSSANPAETQTSKSDFYEDIEPRFSEDAQPNLPHQTQTYEPQAYQTYNPASTIPLTSNMPSALVPGQAQQDYGSQGYSQQDYITHPHPQHQQHVEDYGHPGYTPPPHQDRDAGFLSPADDRRNSQSPAHSDNSNFTSISQRGVNPQWQPGPGQGRGPPQSQFGGSRSAPRPQDDIIASNPDFMIPGAASGRNKFGHQRGLSSGGGGRYPGA